MIKLTVYVWYEKTKILMEAHENKLSVTISTRVQAEKIITFLFR